MRCSEAQARINADPQGWTDSAEDRAVQEHIAGCPACADLERARRLIAKDLAAVADDAGEATMGFDELQQRTHGRLAAGESSSKHQGALRRYAIPAAAAIVVIVVAIVASVNRGSDRDFEVTVAGIDESLLMSGSLERLFDAVGLPDVKFVNEGCNPSCLLKIVGLHNIDDTRLAVAALQSVPSAEIRAVSHYVDKNTGLVIRQTQTSSNLEISNDRWTMELGLDSTVYQKVSVALDSLKQDTTFTMYSWAPSEEDSLAPPEDEYTVHPDGSYSISKRYDPTPGIGWIGYTFTFDSTGNLISHTMVDTAGKVHEIDFRNWARQEQQLKELGLYTMITYDDDGTPHASATNADPTTIPGYGPRLAPGMALNQNEPNPFDSVTAISFTLPEASRVRLTIYDKNSKLVRTLVDSTMAAGDHTVNWNSRSDDGKRVWSQEYLCKMEVGEYYHTIIMYQVW